VLFLFYELVQMTFEEKEWKKEAIEEFCKKEKVAFAQPSGKEDSCHIHCFWGILTAKSVKPIQVKFNKDCDKAFRRGFRNKKTKEDKSGATYEDVKIPQRLWSECQQKFLLLRHTSAPPVHYNTAHYHSCISELAKASILARSELDNTVRDFKAAYSHLQRNVTNPQNSQLGQTFGGTMDLVCAEDYHSDSLLDTQSIASTSGSFLGTLVGDDNPIPSLPSVAATDSFLSHSSPPIGNVMPPATIRTPRAMTQLPSPAETQALPMAAQHPSQSFMLPATIQTPRAMTQLPSPAETQALPMAAQHPSQSFMLPATIQTPRAMTQLPSPAETQALPMATQHPSQSFMPPATMATQHPSHSMTPMSTTAVQQPFQLTAETPALPIAVQQHQQAALLLDQQQKEAEQADALRNPQVAQLLNPKWMKDAELARLLRNQQAAQLVDQQQKKDAGVLRRQVQWAAQLLKDQQTKEASAKSTVDDIAMHPEKSTVADNAARSRGNFLAKISTSILKDDSNVVVRATRQVLIESAKTMEKKAAPATKSKVNPTKKKPGTKSTTKKKPVQKNKVPKKMVVAKHSNRAPKVITDTVYATQTKKTTLITADTMSCLNAELKHHICVWAKCGDCTNKMKAEDNLVDGKKRSGGQRTAKKRGVCSTVSTETIVRRCNHGSLASYKVTDKKYVVGNYADGIRNDEE